MADTSIVDQRAPVYGDAHELANKVMDILERDPAWKFFPYKYDISCIVGKVCRALHSPNRTDHYEDMAGYCELIRRDVVAKFVLPANTGHGT